VVLETIADEQMRIFRRSNNIGLTMQKGLWAYSRHPNYLGEILFWWGLYFMTLSLEPDLWYLFVCPLIMNLMFSLITCQMMDNRSLEKRPDYQEYMNSTRQLIIWKSVKKGE
jgi:steroid 5-alpha reductase family enzyme